MSKEKVSLDHFNDILKNKCKAFGVLAQYDKSGVLSVSGHSAYANGEVHPECQKILSELLEAYELGD